MRRIPELDRSVLRATASGQEALLVRAPSDRLDSCLVLVELSKGLRGAASAPQDQLVVVAAGSELLIVERPFEATYLLTVTD